MQEELKALQRRTRIDLSKAAPTELAAETGTQKLLCVPLSEGAVDDYWWRGDQ